MKQLTITLLLLLIAFLSGCEEEILNSDLLPGFWVQEAIYEDDSEVTMSDCESSVRLLIEQNGVYRLQSSCDTMERSGTWLITNDTILDLSIDRWNGSNKYEPYPVRFSILQLSDLELEIRIKTFIGERKKMVFFTPLPQDSTQNLSDQEILDLDRYNKTLRTYRYRFGKND
jgi:hypothetical protein